MKLAILSDSHDNLPNIYKALDYIKIANIDTIIHCGDVCAPAVLEEFGKNFSGNIYISRGNVDGDYGGFERVLKKFPNIKIFKETGNITIEKIKIGFVHNPDIAHVLARGGKFDVIFYGHNHTPWEKKVGKTLLVNPGTLAGLFAKATFAVFDTKEKKADLVLVEKI